MQKQGRLHLVGFSSILLILTVGISCLGSETQGSSAPSSADTKSAVEVDLVHTGISIEVPNRYKLITKENLDSLKKVVTGLAKLRSPCDGSLTNVDALLRNDQMQMLVDVQDSQNNIVIVAHPLLSFTKEQTASAITSICGKMFHGFNMIRISDTTGTLPIGPYYKAKFFIEGPDHDYVSNSYLISSKIRSYTITFNGNGIKDQHVVLQSIRESSLVINQSIDLAAYLSRVNPSLQQTLTDSSMLYLYRMGKDTSASEAGSVITVPECCVFTLPEGTELQSSAYRQYSQSVIRMVGKNDQIEFYVQQEGLNKARPEAFKTYFRFSVRRSVLPPEQKDYTMADLTNEELDYLKETYTTAKKSALLESQRILSIEEPQKFRLGTCDGVRLGHVRETDGKRTTSKMMILISKGKHYIIEVGYRQDDKLQWEATIDQLLNSLVLL